MTLDWGQRYFSDSFFCSIIVTINFVLSGVHEGAGENINVQGCLPLVAGPFLRMIAVASHRTNINEKQYTRCGVSKTLCLHSNNHTLTWRNERRQQNRKSTMCNGSMTKDHTDHTDTN